MTNYVKESWVRDFSYDEYVMFCRSMRGRVVSEYAYGKWCAYFNYLMEKDMEKNT